MQATTTRSGRALRAVAALFFATILAACGGHVEDPEAVSITAQPSDVSVVEGAAAVFIVVATGSSPMSYQWSSSSDGGASFTNIGSATAASYSIAATTFAQNGLRLRVVVTNSQGSVTSSSVALTVTRAVVAPAITVQPSDVVVTAPNTATFRVTATGTSPSYAWQMSSDGTIYAAVAGAANAATLDVAGTSTAMNGQRYRVVVSNSAGSVTSNPALLSVSPTPIAPAFTTQPLAQSISAGLGASFTVAATGTPAPAIQWQLNGSPIADGALTGVCAGATATGTTTATLTLSSVPIGCSGAAFTAVASNGVAPVATSSPATLTVSPALAAPVVTSQPTNASVNAGATATFTAVASGVPTPAVQWQLSGDGGITYANITGATTGSYTTPALALADSGKKYRAVFSNGSGSATTSAATLTVGVVPATPVLTGQPASITVIAGATATFSATASGTPAPTVQWQLSTDGGATYANVAGATSTSYTTPATAVADSGKKYRAVFSNASGSATSNAATLTVSAAPATPTVNTQPANVSVIAGATATFTADASGVPTPSVQWQLSSDGGATYTNIFGANAGTYTTPATILGDSGKSYRAVFSNASGNATSSGATLTVTAAPVAPAITTQPADVSIVAGATATFTAAASGTPTPTVQWQLSTDGGATFANIAGATAASFTTAATTMGDNGKKYRAVFSNASGTATSSAATLSVTVAATLPVVTTQPANTSVAIGSGATFTAAATGTPAPTVQWQLSIDGGFVFNNVVGATSSSYTLVASSVLQSGWQYRAVFTNSAGSVTTSAATLTVTAAPVAPAITTQPSNATVTAGASATFTAAATGTPAPTVQWQISNDGGLSFSAIAGATSPTYTFATASVLESGRQYRAVFSNSAGSATSNAATLTVTAPTSAPAITAQPLDATVTTPTTATFTATASGTPAPTAQWQLSTDGGASYADIFAANSPSYTTPPTTVADSGKKYRAVFDNSAGTAISNAATLTVNAPAPSTLALLAGSVGGAGNLDGTGTAARFDLPYGTAVDAAGNVYVADRNNNTIRKITPAGVVSTFAGHSGSTGAADGPGNLAYFNSPAGLAIDATGNLYVADTFNYTIRKISPAGVVSTLAGTAGSNGAADGSGAAAQFFLPQSLAVDGSGNVYVADTGSNTIRKITPAGMVTTLAGTAGNAGSANGTGAAARFSLPAGIASDAAGNVYVADSYNQTIRKITAAGVVTTFAGSAGNSGSADGVGAAARFNYPFGVAVDAAGNVYVNDTFNYAIRKITSGGVVTTITGQPGFGPGAIDGSLATARFHLAYGQLAVDASGANLYLADTLNQTIRKITTTTVSTLAGLASQYGINEGTGSAASFYGPRGVVVDPAGNIYVADSYNSAIRKISTVGVVSLVAGGANFGYADGLGAAAQFERPAAIAIDSAGNLYVADSSNSTIRKVTPSGVVTTIAGNASVAGSSDGIGTAATFNGPTGIAVDATGNIYVADTNNQTVRKITAGGSVSTLAGAAGAYGYVEGMGATARFGNLAGLTVDGAGNLYVADASNHAIRKITPAGLVSTFAGGSFGSLDGTGTVAKFFNPSAISLDTAGNLYVADTYNHIIRKITSAGLVTTVVGVAGSSGIRLGSSGRLYQPFGIAAVGTGRLVISSLNGVFVYYLP